MKTPSAQDQAELIGTRLIIWDYKSGLGIYRSGFFGKPVGIPKPKPDQDFEVPLLLDLMEGLYLLEHKRIGVIDGRSKKPVGRSVLLKAAKETYRGFSAVYEHGPGIDHAPFIVSAETPESVMGPFEVVRAGRLATTVRKHFIIAIPDTKSGKIRYLVFQWFKA